MKSMLLAGAFAVGVAAIAVADDVHPITKQDASDYYVQHPEQITPKIHDCNLNHWRRTTGENAGDFSCAGGFDAVQRLLQICTYDDRVYRAGAVRDDGYICTATGTPPPIWQPPPAEQKQP